MTPRNIGQHVPIKLQDVAQKAGVSLTTASFALRGSRRVAPETTKRILEIAKALSYTPDPSARNLASNFRKSGAFHGTIGLLLQKNFMMRATLHLQSKHKRDFFDALPETAAALGHTMDLFAIPETAKESQALARVLKARNIRGLIIDTGNVPIPDFGFPWEGFATVVMGTDSSGKIFHNISCHSFKDTYSVVQECWKRNYRKPGLVIDRNSFPDWEGGYDAAVSLCRIQAGSCSLDLPEWNEQLFLRWFKKYKPDLVIANHGAKPLHALASVGLKAPRDYGFFALDLHGLEEAVSGYEQMRLRCNQLAVEMVHGFLRREDYGSPEVATSVQVNSHWVEGKTLRSS